MAALPLAAGQTGCRIPGHGPLSGAASVPVCGSGFRLGRVVSDGFLSGDPATALASIVRWFDATTFWRFCSWRKGTVGVKEDKVRAANEVGYFAKTVLFAKLFRCAVPDSGPVGATLKCRFISIGEVWLSVFISNGVIIVFFTKTYESVDIGRGGAG